MNTNVTRLLNLIETKPGETLQKVAWTLFEIAEATGLSMSFLRYEVKRGNLPVKKFGRRILVLNQDFNTYLENGSQGSKTPINSIELN